MMLIRRMTHADIALGMRLKAQNGWNQLEADWRRQLELEPNGGFVAEVDGQGVGTACACVFGDVAWISMVLVDREHRNQGIGTALMRHLLQCLDERGVPTIRLDATPLGRPVYQKLGFEGDFELTRCEGVMATTESVVGMVRIMPEDMPELCTLDAGVTQTRREKLLRNVFEANPSETRKYAASGKLQGFLMCRPGSNAWQIGPVVGSMEAGRLLLLDAAQRFARKRVYVDVPVDHPGAANLAKSIGLKPQRQFLRMTRGKPMREDLHQYWASGGPEKG
jgi:GNAT superfamily N-acetyltransferase